MLTPLPVATEQEVARDAAAEAGRRDPVPDHGGAELDQLRGIPGPFADFLNDLPPRFHEVDARAFPGFGLTGFTVHVLRGDGARRPARPIRPTRTPRPPRRRKLTSVIAFATAITDPGLYSRCAQPGIELAVRAGLRGAAVRERRPQQPRWDLRRAHADRLDLPQLQPDPRPLRGPRRPRGAGAHPPGRGDRRPRLLRPDPGGARGPGGRASSAAPERSGSAASPGGRDR